MGDFFKKAFSDMKQSAKAQHQVDKAEFNAARAESRAQWEQAKVMGKPSTHKAAMQKQRDEKIQAANQRQAEAEARIAELKETK